MGLNDTLGEACGLLDDLGTCDPSIKGECKDFKKTKKILEQSCDLQTIREERMYNPDDWISMGDYQFKRITYEDAKFLIYVIAIIIPVAILYTFIHEAGHWLTVKAMGWEVLEFKISFFPFLLDLGGYVMYLPSTIPEPWQIVVISSSGSLHSFLWAYVFFALFYNFKMNRYAEAHLVLYSAILGLDAITYIFFDLFISHYGDWWKIFQISPITVGVIFSLCILNVVLFIVFFKKIRNRIDL